MNIYFTPLALQAFKLSDCQKQRKVFDSEQKSLGVVIDVHGSKAFFVIYRDEAGKLRQRVIGSYSKMSISKAREKAAQVIKSFGASTLDKYLKKAGLKGMTMNDLRHTQLSAMSQTGADLGSIEYALRHKQPRIAEFYLHPTATKQGHQ